MLRPFTLLLIASTLLLPFFALADDEADTLMQRIADRDRGDDLVWDLTINLIDSSGNTRTRGGKIYRREFDGEDRSEQVTVFLSPANIRYTALLDIESGSEDFMWLYLPALKATKRVPPTDRGDKFVGTDFTMEDVDLGFKHKDYEGRVIEHKTQDGHPITVMRIKPKTEQLAREVGFDESLLEVRSDTAIIVDQRYFKNGREIRHNQADNIRKVDGIDTTMELRSHDLVNNHRTTLTVTNARYNSGIPDSRFRKESLGQESYR